MAVRVCFSVLNTFTRARTARARVYTEREREREREREGLLERGLIRDGERGGGYGGGGGGRVRDYISIVTLTPPE